MLTRHFGLLAVATMIGIFIASLQLSPGYSVNSFYLFPILLAIWTPHPQSAFRLAALSTALIGANTYLTPPAVLAVTAVNRTIFATNLWLVAFIIVRYRRTEAMRRADVSARHEAEQALRRSDKNLEDMRYALDQSAILATTDVDGSITYVNDTFCETSKYSREELIGQNHRILNAGLHPPAFFEEMYATIAGGRVWRGEIQNRAKDGGLYWHDMTIVPFLDEERRPYQYVAIRYDITERKRSEAALRDQEALARLGKMAAIVAHEVRNPLAGIRGAVQVIGRRLTSPQEQTIVAEIVARIDTLNTIVQDLLLFARPSQPVLAPTPVAAVLARTAALFAHDPTFASVSLRIDPTDAIVNADPEQLKLVLFNLLLNGAQAMNGRGAIVVATTTAGGAHEIRISDQGPGIAAHVREHVFEPFFTTRHQGTGLGLVTARQIIEAHGGTVALDCPAEGGAVAIVRLPVMK